MHAAVAQLAVVEIHFLGALAGQFCHSGHGLALAFAVLNLLEHHLGGLEILVEEVIELLLEEVAYEFGDCGSFGTHIAAAEFGFCLRFEHRLLHLYRYGCNHAVADVGVFEVLTEILLDGARNALFERCEVRATLGGVLPVDKRVVFLAILVGMR